MRDNMYAEAWCQLIDHLNTMTTDPRLHELEQHTAERILEIMDTLIR